MDISEIKSFSLGNISLSVKEIPKHSYVKHYLCYVLGGDYEETCERRLLTCITGDLVIYPAGNIHFNNFNPETNNRVYISFENSFFDKYKGFTSIFELYGKIGHPQVSVLMQKILNEFKQIDKYNALMIETLLVELLINIGRTKISLGKIIPQWLQKIIELIHKDYASKNTLDSLAQMVNIHPTYLVNAFKHYMHQTPGEYIRNIRIRNACVKLNSNLAIAQVAFECGFADQSHLTRLFKKAMGMTPLTYRNKFN